MKKKISTIRFFIVTLLITLTISCSSSDEDINNNTHEMNHELLEGKIRHIVLFKFKESITTSERNEVIKRFTDLRNATKNGKKYIHSIEYGNQNSKEGVDKDYEIAFLVTFNSLADRDYYVGKPFLTAPGTFDPQHDAFKNFVGPFLDLENANGGVLVFDYVLKY
ncbi:Dabb family protein [Tenacibaculum maritimum]|uniref:Probable lipoprotein n=2 Tax=Tenacibaculum maritimum TaxID=107401 RepID=A0A2H1ED55_9FLAO|nr:Dabb family protein [Tenacibaculum maritimum]CAA0187548.1 Probable lipoprotein precursor [Tenacibaculum maritimum]SFZ84635.1 Probable lipoprotein precursor [Tenacibaculum maritimum NCIMB 2154]